MNNSSWVPEVDLKGLADNFFENLIEHIDDLPLEDIVTADDDDGDWDSGFQNLVPPPLDLLTSLSSDFTCKGHRVGVQNPVPIVKQSCSSDVSCTVDSSPPDVKVSKLSLSTSPFSVLMSTKGSVLSQNQNRLAFPVKKGIRSKRKCPTTMTFLRSFVSDMSQQFIPDESASETYLSAEKKRKRNKSSVTRSISYNPKPFNSDRTDKKCTHCLSTKTPQWREGPNGPKTLCNACGVRFRSGRLVPEYRPASSPTFIPTVHSNMHKKIIMMRKKYEDQFDITRNTCDVTSRAYRVKQGFVTSAD